jgi:PhzF family phenazine biosynthesis protein
MQQVAQEMNLSETAFLLRQEDGYRLRWFTPAVEVDLCGHATLASAHTLFETDILDAHDEARFHTRSGLLTARYHDDRIELNFPATPASPAELPSTLKDALGVVPKHVGKSRFDYLIEVGSEDEVRGLAPDFAVLRTLPVRGIMVTSAASTPSYDFVSRFFAPSAGIDEDPVTGSAHCCLGPYWGEKLNKQDLLAYQASARGGTIRVVLHGDRVRLSGRAVTVFRGNLVEATDL